MTAEIVPIRTPIVNQRIAAPEIRKSVFGRRSKMSALTSASLTNELPKSKWSTRPLRYTQNCSGTGLSSPSCSRIAFSVSGVGERPARSAAGSAVGRMKKMKNVIATTNSSTTIM